MFLQYFSAIYQRARLEKQSVPSDPSPSAPSPPHHFNVTIKAGWESSSKRDTCCYTLTPVSTLCQGCGNTVWSCEATVKHITSILHMAKSKIIVAADQIWGGVQQPVGRVCGAPKPPARILAPHIHLTAVAHFKKCSVTGNALIAFLDSFTMCRSGYIAGCHMDWRGMGVL